MTRGLAADRPARLPSIAGSARFRRVLVLAPLLCAGCESSESSAMLILEILALSALVIGAAYMQSLRPPEPIEPNITEVRERRAAAREYAAEAAARRLRSSRPRDVHRGAADLIRQAGRIFGLQPPFRPGTRFSWGCAEQRAALVDRACGVPRRQGGETFRVSEIVWAEDTPACSAVVVRAVVETPGADPAAARVELWPLHRPEGGSWQLGAGVDEADHPGFTDPPVPGAGVFAFDGVPCVHETRDAAVAAFWRFVRASRSRTLSLLEGVASPALLRSVGDSWRRQQSGPVGARTALRLGGAEIVGAEIRGDLASVVAEVSWMHAWEGADAVPRPERAYLILERKLARTGRWTLAHFSWGGDDVIAARIERAILAARAPAATPAAVLAWAAAAATADGRVSRGERAGLMRMAIAAGISADDATALLTAAATASRRAGDGLPNTVPSAPEGDGRAWLRSAVLIAIDGGLSRPELAVLTRLGASIGMSPKDVRGFVNEVIASQLAAAPNPPPGAARA